MALSQEHLTCTNALRPSSESKKAPHTDSHLFLFRYYSTMAELPFPLLQPDFYRLILSFTCLICILGKTKTPLCMQTYCQVDSKLLSVDISRSFPISMHNIISLQARMLQHQYLSQISGLIQEDTLFYSQNICQDCR